MIKRLLRSSGIWPVTVPRRSHGKSRRQFLIPGPSSTPSTAPPIHQAHGPHTVRPSVSRRDYSRRRNIAFLTPSTF